MNKNIIIKVTAGILAASTFLCAYGCKKKNDGINAENMQPSVTDGTAVIRYTSVDKDGNKVEASTVANVSDYINMGTIEDKLSDQFKDEAEKDKFANSGNEIYNISDEKVQEIIDNSKDWATFHYTIYIANPNDKKIAFQNIECGEDKDIILNKSLDCEYALPSGVGTEIPISGLVNLKKYPDAEDLDKAISKMDIKIIYTIFTQGESDVEDWEKVTTYKMPVSLGKSSK